MDIEDFESLKQLINNMYSKYCQHSPEIFGEGKNLDETEKLSRLTAFIQHVLQDVDKSNKKTSEQMIEGISIGVALNKDHTAITSIFTKSDFGYTRISWTNNMWCLEGSDSRSLNAAEAMDICNQIANDDAASDEVKQNFLIVKQLIISLDILGTNERKAVEDLLRDISHALESIIADKYGYKNVIAHVFE